MEYEIGTKHKRIWTYLGLGYNVHESGHVVIVRTTKTMIICSFEGSLGPIIMKFDKKTKQQIGTKNKLSYFSIGEKL